MTHLKLVLINTTQDALYRDQASVDIYLEVIWSQIISCDSVLNQTEQSLVVISGSDLENTGPLG